MAAKRAARNPRGSKARKLSHGGIDVMVDAIGKGESYAAAARLANVTYQTLTRWLNQGREDRRLSRRSIYRTMVDRFDDARLSCLGTLDAIEWRIATDPEQPAGSRLRAVESIRNRILFAGRKPVDVNVNLSALYGEATSAVNAVARGDVIDAGDTPAVDGAAAPVALLPDSAIRAATIEQLLAALSGLADEDPP